MPTIKQPMSMSSISNLRDLFSHNNKEKLQPDLKQALSLLELTSLDDLEQRVLSTEAFLQPWAVFRDAFLLVNPNTPFEACRIERLDILWFYTQFDEGVRRYDRRLDFAGQDHAPESSPHGVINKSIWGPAEYEKHLHVWLLQTFKVGKRYNIWGFEYFELKSICTAWEEVFVPIVNAVRASYSPKGRRHYGRLASFIEDIYPSRLAFPEGNVAAPIGSMMSPTPFRVVSKPCMPRDTSQAMLTNKNYDETERELRNVYPQYGGLVERPRFKQKMEEWLAEQRARATRRKVVSGQDKPQTVYDLRPQDMASTSSPSHSRNPIKRCSESLRRSMPVGISTNRPVNDGPTLRSETPQTPRSLKPKPSKSRESLCAGRMRDLRNSPIISKKLPEEAVHPPMQTPTRVPRRDHFPSLSSVESGTILLPPQDTSPFKLQQFKASKDDIHTSIHKPSPYSDISTQVVVAPIHQHAVSNNSVFSPMGAPSAVPRPLFNNESRIDEQSPIETGNYGQPLAARRLPSYEGTGYRDEIPLTDLQVVKTSHADQTAKVKSKAPSRLPTPIRVQSIPYTGPLKAVASDTNHHITAPQPKAIPWPGFSDPPPAVPAKNPNRWHSRHSHSHSHSHSHVTANQLVREEQASVLRIVSEENIRAAIVREDQASALRIVSKENIRAVLAGTSPAASTETLGCEEPVPPAPSRAKTPETLKTFNSHMFPRKEYWNGTPYGR